MSFLLSRRWLIFFLTVGVMAYGAWWLGQWQFDRLHAKHDDNARIQHNLAQAPVPVASLLEIGKTQSKSVEWRRVTIHGTWDDAHTLVLKYQTNERGVAGVRVATPLVTRTGVVLVERGWMSSPNNGAERPSTPVPTAGEVTVTGWVRINATGDATNINDRSTRALSALEYAHWTGETNVYGNVVNLESQVPAPKVFLGQVDMPDDTGDGPHFFYGLQWWFFGFLAVFGFFYLAYDERRRFREAATAKA